MHPEAREFVERAVAERGPFKAVLEVGGRDVNGGVRDLFGGADYTSIDLAGGPGVDVVANAAHWNPGAKWYDCVVCCEVLKHAPEAEAIVRRARLWLEPRGTLIVTCAGPGRAPHSGVDGWALREGEHYANVGPAELARWLEDYRTAEVSVNEAHGDVYAAATR